VAEQRRRDASAGGRQPEPIKELRRLVDSWNERRVKGQQRAVK
jgi:hypothetical protein